MRVAAIDVGTNTVLLTIAHTSSSGVVEPLLERATITRLGHGLDRSGELDAEAARRTLAALSDYAELIRNANVSRVAAVGTSALRDARGAQDFLIAANALLQKPLRVVGGEEEARLSFMGATSGMDVEGPIVVFDVGGGSTEIVYGAITAGSVRVDRALSFDIGSVRLFERHVRSDPPTPIELKHAGRDISDALGELSAAPGATVVGVAGTVTTLAAVDQGLEHRATSFHGSALKSARIEALSAELARLTLAERLALPGIEPGRADVIPVGAAITCAVVARLGAESVRVSDRGVRWGLVIELVADNRE